jgi:hypothetical protein
MLDLIVRGERALDVKRCWVFVRRHTQSVFESDTAPAVVLRAAGRAQTGLASQHAPLGSSKQNF